jgi:Ca-activated chloride channel family protein
VKWISYSRYTGEDFGISAEDLMRALSDFLLQSGFESQYMQFNELDQNALERLKEAIEQALRNGELFDPEQAQQMAERLEAMSDSEFQQLVEQMVQKLADEGYINTEQPGQQGRNGEPRDVKFQVTDKSVDFLGFKTLKDLMGGLGRSSFGAHDTREMSTGVETSGSSKLYEFGDTLNLDVSETLFSALRREGVGLPLNLEYQDLHVHQSEYQSSCATVLMLDCSHSMILYGEDRFTAGKEGGSRTRAFDRTQYPGRQSASRSIPRFLRKSCGSEILRRRKSVRTTRTHATASAWLSGCSTRKRRT